jgi:sugar/nucleoside kinase (ribokinase family)
VTVRPVVVVGDVGLDVLVRPQAGVVRGGDTPSDVRIVPGGAGGNTAAWLASAGVPVALVSRVGDDDAGAAARRRLESDGVVCRFATDTVLPTCTVVVLLEDDERTMLPDRGANAALSPDDLDLAGAAASLASTGVAADRVSAAGIPHLHLSGFVLLDPRSRPAGVAALESARSLGWTTSVDPQAANHVDRVGAGEFLDWAKGVDLLLPNEIEAQALGGDEAMLGAAKTAAVSLGAGGARWATRAHTWRVPAPSVVSGDRTGCGDAFDAGVLAAWLSGAEPEEALTRGVQLGSRAAGRTGARP